MTDIQTEYTQLYRRYQTEGSFIFSLQFLTGVLMSSCSLTGISDERTLCFWKLNIQFKPLLIWGDLSRHVAEQRRGARSPLLLSFRGVCGLCRISRCKCGGSRWLRKRRCTWGTSSDVCRSASWRTRSRKRGSTWSALRPSPSSCSTDTWDGPGGGEETIGTKVTSWKWWTHHCLQKLKWEVWDELLLCTAETKVVQSLHWSGPLLRWDSWNQV